MTAMDLPDTLNARIGVLTRREVEARMLAPLIDALGARFGREAVIETVRAAIIEIARAQGERTAAQVGGGSMQHLDEAMAFWKQDDALHMEVIALDSDTYNFNVTRCRYAELYNALGIPELGAVLSCNRDAAFIEGFNPGVSLARTQTIMQGAGYCDFRYSATRVADSNMAVEADL
jgi:hypothetical protein